MKVTPSVVGVFIVQPGVIRKLTTRCSRERLERVVSFLASTGSQEQLSASDFDCVINDACLLEDSAIEVLSNSTAVFEALKANCWNVSARNVQALLSGRGGVAGGARTLGFDLRPTAPRPGSGGGDGGGWVEGTETAAEGTRTLVAAVSATGAAGAASAPADWGPAGASRGGSPARSFSLLVRETLLTFARTVAETESDEAPWTLFLSKTFPALLQRVPNQVERLGTAPGVELPVLPGGQLVPFFLDAVGSISVEFLVLLKAVRGGDGALPRPVFVSGASGMGKTKLVLASAFHDEPFFPIVLLLGSGMTQELTPCFESMVSAIEEVLTVGGFSDDERLGYLVVIFRATIALFVLGAAHVIRILPDFAEFRSLEPVMQRRRVKEVVFWSTRFGGPALAPFATRITNLIRNAKEQGGPAGVRKCVESMRHALRASFSALNKALRACLGATEEMTPVVLFDEAPALLKKLSGRVPSLAAERRREAPFLPIEATGPFGSVQPSKSVIAVEDADDRRRLCDPEGAERRDLMYGLLMVCDSLCVEQLCIPIVMGTSFSILSNAIADTSPVQASAVPIFVGSKFHISKEMMAGCLTEIFGVHAAFQPATFARLEGRASFFFNNFLKEYACLTNDASKFESATVSRFVNNAWRVGVANMWVIIQNYASRETLPRRGTPAPHALAELLWADRARHGVVELGLIGDGTPASVGRVVKEGILSVDPTLATFALLTREPVVRASLRFFSDWSLTSRRDVRVAGKSNVWRTPIDSWLENEFKRMSNTASSRGFLLEDAVAWSVIATAIQQSGTRGATLGSILLGGDSNSCRPGQMPAWALMSVEARVGFSFAHLRTACPLPTSFHALFARSPDGRLETDADGNFIPLLGRVVFKTEDSASGPDVMFWVVDRSSAPADTTVGASSATAAREPEGFDSVVILPVDDEADARGRWTASLSPETCRLVVMQVKQDKGLTLAAALGTLDAGTMFLSDPQKRQVLSGTWTPEREAGSSRERTAFLDLAKTGARRHFDRWIRVVVATRPASGDLLERVEATWADDSPLWIASAARLTSRLEILKEAVTTSPSMGMAEPEIRSLAHASMAYVLRDAPTPPIAVTRETTRAGGVGSGATEAGPDGSDSAL